MDEHYHKIIESLQKIYTYFNLALEENWYYFTLISLLLYGIYYYLLDYFINHKKRSLTTSVATCSIVAGNGFSVVILTFIIIVIYFYKNEFIFGFFAAFLLGTVQGILFFFGNSFKFESRRIYPQHIVLSITKTNILLVIIFSWFILGEFASVTSYNFVGLFLIGLSIYLFRDFEIGKGIAEKSKKLKKDSHVYIKGMLYLGLATIVAAAISLLAKYAVDPFNLNIFLFMFFSNFFSCCAGLYFIYSEKRKRSEKLQTTDNNQSLNHDITRAFKKGVWLGIINFASYACLLKALSIGDASVIIPIFSLYIVIPLLLTCIIQGEKLTEKATVAVILSILAVMILKL